MLKVKQLGATVRQILRAELLIGAGFFAGCAYGGLLAGLGFGS